MHGKAQREPAPHSVLDCKLVPLHNKWRPCGNAGSVSQCENLGGGQKLANRSQPFLDQSSPNLGHVGSPCRLISFFPIVDIMFCCRDTFGQSSKLVPKSVFCPPAREGKCPRKFGPKSSHKWICVQVLLRSVQWPQRLGVEKTHKGKI